MIDFDARDGAGVITLNDPQASERDVQPHAPRAWPSSCAGRNGQGDKL
jgi:hypothetical protein